MIEDSDGPPTKRPFRNCPASSPTALPSTSVGLAQIQRGERLGCSVRPLILRGRKRAQEELTTEQAPIYSSERFIKTNLVAIRQGLEARGRLESEGDAYVQQLIEKMGGRFDSLVSTRKVTASQQSDSSVRKRLSSRSDCDLRALSCFVPLCGRSFDSLQVLAWHMSYAHQDVSSSDPRNTICYLCGYTMSTAKGKNAHLTTKHRSIAERHNMECIEQRGSIIAPGAPAAERLRMKEVQMKAVGEHNTYEEQRSRTVKRQEVPSAIDAYTARILDDGDEPPLTENYGARFVDLPIDLAAEEFL